MTINEKPKSQEILALDYLRPVESMLLILYLGS